MKFNGQKMGSFYYFLRLSSRIFHRSEDFLQISAEHMSCWHPYCAVGVPADAINVVG
jgi:hypothetical protein